MVGREVFLDLYQYLFFRRGKKPASSLEGTYFWTLFRNSLTLSILNTLIYPSACATFLQLLVQLFSSLSSSLISSLSSSLFSSLCCFPTAVSPAILQVYPRAFLLACPPASSQACATFLQLLVQLIFKSILEPFF
jgi:hypothetical protein